MSTYSVIEPKRRTTSVLFASPHSGRDYPQDLLSRTVLDPVTIRSSEDAFVDQLFSSAPRFGAPLLLAKTPRAYVDLNRSADEMDHALIEGVRKVSGNPRVASGLGVIPRVVANGRAIYRGKLTREEADNRMKTVWYPYHAALQGLIAKNVEDFGRAILIDCHSMPHEAIQTMSRGRHAPDVVLGDRFGATAAGSIVDTVEAIFTSAGLTVARNSPFAGAFTATHYGFPSKGQHVIQVEIDRGLYMDETTLMPHSGFDAFRQTVNQVIAAIAAIGRRDAMPMAAE